MALAAGADPARISYGNTIKKEADIAARLRAGRAPVRLRQRGRAGQDRPRRAGQPRVLPHPDHGRGCRLAAVAQVRLRARHGARAADPRRRAWAWSPGACRSMSARSRRTRPPGRRRWPRPPGCSATSRPSASSSAWSIWAAASPRPTARTCPTPRPMACEIMAAVRRQFGNRIPFLIAEPGRGLVGNAGVIQTEVVLIAEQGRRRRAALGLSRHRQVRRPRRDHGRGDPVPDRQPPHRRAGAGDPGRPDLRQRRRALRAQPATRLPADLEVGDRLEIGATGAYTTTYAAVGFNGFDPLRAYCI